MWSKYDFDDSDDFDFLMILLVSPCTKLYIRFWLTIDEKTAAERRRNRADYIVAEDASYFSDKVWPEVKRREALIKTRSDIELVADSTVIYNYCNSLIS